MTKQVYELETDKSSEENRNLALFAIANELHEINIFVALLGYGNKVLPDGTSYEMGAIENLAFEVKKAAEAISDSLEEKE